MLDAFDQPGCSRVDLRREVNGRLGPRFALERCRQAILVLLGRFELEVALQL